MNAETTISNSSIIAATNALSSVIAPPPRKTVNAAEQTGVASNEKYEDVPIAVRPTIPTIKEYCGHRVEVGTSYDLTRKISVGSARDNRIIASMCVSDALERVRSNKFKQIQKNALELCHQVENYLRLLLKHFHDNGNFYFDDKDEMLNLHPKKRIEITQELTNIIKERTEKDEVLLKSKLHSIAWRCAKTMVLNGFLWAGVFGVRNNSGLLNSSGLMCVDLDKVTVNIVDLLNLLDNDKLVFFAAVSPSRKGAKILVRIPDDAAGDPKKYLACYETFARYLTKCYPAVSVSIDKQAKAVAQLCFFMHDSEARCRRAAYVLIPDADLFPETVKDLQNAQPRPSTLLKVKGNAATEAENETTKKRQQKNDTSQKSPFDRFTPEKQWETVKSAVESLGIWFANLPSGVGERNSAWTKIGFAFGAWLKQLNNATIEAEAKEYLLDLAAQHYAGNESCVERAIESSDGRVGLGTLFSMAKINGAWQAPWTVDDGEDESKRKWVVMESVEEFQKVLGKEVKCVTDQWYVCENGLWLPSEKNIFEPIALKILPFNIRNSKRASEVLATFQQQQQVARSALRTASIWENDAQQAVLINCRNGLLRVTADGAELSAHNPEEFCFTGQLSAAYDAKALCPVFDRVMQEAQPEEKYQLLLCWWFGYILYPSLKFRTCLINYGPSGTGKSTLFEHGIGKVLGTTLTKNLSLSDICSPTGYSVPSLQHMLLNIGGELDADELARSSRFKLLVGGENVEVRRIYGRPFTMEGYITKQIYLTNHLPRFKSGTDAELKRLSFLKWDRSIPRDKQDSTIQETLLGEKDGIFSQCMVLALVEILRGWVQPQDEESTRRRFAIINDPVTWFVEHCCVVDANASVLKADLFRAFDKFAEHHDLNNNLREASVFGKLLMDATYGKVKVARPSGGAGQRVNVYTGIRLNPETQSELTKSIPVGAGSEQG